MRRLALAALAAGALWLSYEMGRDTGYGEGVNYMMRLNEMQRTTPAELL